MKKDSDKNESNSMDDMSDSKYVKYLVWFGLLVACVFLFVWLLSAK